MALTRYLSSLFVAGALLLPVVTTGCAGGVAVGYNYYDPYYHDYHHWDDAELGFYNRWAGETHRPNRPYNKLRHSEQHEYWNWRHNHH
jgi:hypothetical protein